MADKHEQVITALVDAKGVVLQASDFIYVVPFESEYARLREQLAKQSKASPAELFAKEVAPPPFTLKIK